MAELNIIEQTAYNPDLASDYDNLLASLHLVDEYKHSPLEIQALCETEGSSLYLGMAGQVAVAMTTLIHPYASLGHRTAVIEDVAVQRYCKGNGYGLSLLDFAVAEARQLGADRVELHSKAVRHEAHGLYRKIGFEIIDTNLFRKEF